MKELKIQLVMVLMLLITIFIGWIFLTVLRAVLSSLSMPALIIVICIILYKFLNLR